MPADDLRGRAVDARMDVGVGHDRGPAAAEQLGLDQWVLEAGRFAAQGL